MTELSIIFGINILASLFKGYIEPRWGKIGVQVSVFGMSLVGAWYALWGQNIDTVELVVTNGIMMFALAVAFYEVLWKHFDIFKFGTSGKTG